MRFGDRKQHVEVLTLLQTAYRALEKRVPPPTTVKIGGDTVLRYVEQTLGQASLLKLARIISGLRAIDLLLSQGLLQEQTVIQRTVDDFTDEIMFFYLAFKHNDFTDDYKLLLSTFWNEQLDSNGFLTSRQPPVLKKQKIRSYITDRLSPNDPHTVNEAAKTLYKTTSSFVHGASVSIMDMFAGDPPGYVLEGVPGTTRQREYARDASNYFYRSVIAAHLVAKIVGDDVLAGILAGTARALEAS